MRFTIALLVLMTGLSAHAAGLIGQAPPVPIPGPGPTPGPVGGTSFSQLYTMFAATPAGSHAAFNGTWMLVSEATSNECSYWYQPQSNPNGIVNPDGSRNELVFANFQSTNGVVLGVSFYNIAYANYNQGPFSVGANEPQFAQWGYSSNSPAPTNQIYIDWTCRGVQGQPYQMVCGEKMNLVNPSEFNPQTQACANDPYGAFQVYQYISQ